MWSIYCSVILLTSIVVAYIINSKILFKRSFIYFFIFAFLIGLTVVEGISNFIKNETYIYYFMLLNLILNLIINGIIFLIEFYKAKNYNKKINLKFLIPYSILSIGINISFILISFFNLLNFENNLELIQKYSSLGINLFASLVLFVISVLYKHKNKLDLIIASLIIILSLCFEGYSIQPILSIIMSISMFFVYNSLESGINYYDFNEYNYNGEIFENFKQEPKKNQSLLYILINENEANKDLILNKIFKYNFYKISSNLYGIILRKNKMNFIAENINTFIKFMLYEKEINLKYNSYILTYEFLKENNFYAKDITNYLKSLTFKEENKLHIFDTNDIKLLLENKKLLQMIDDAIKNDGFEMYYQPIYSTKYDKFVSAEALIRFKDKETLGFISPEVFIPLAEKKGYAEEIGKLVFKKVCSFYKENDLSNKYNMKYIELNVSGLHITTKNIVNDFNEILEKFELLPENINIEITETAEIINKKQMNENLSKLRKLGFKFSMDDFGSGYSNLTNIVSNGYELIKIDKSLLWDAFKEDWKQEDSKILLETCINLGHFLHRHIVVEGVETKEMVEYLKEKNVEYLQGYYFSKPISEKEFLKFIEDNNFNEERSNEASEYLMENLLK